MRAFGKKFIGLSNRCSGVRFVLRFVLFRWDTLFFFFVEHLVEDLRVFSSLVLSISVDYSWGLMGRVFHESIAVLLPHILFFPFFRI